MGEGVVLDGALNEEDGDAVVFALWFERGSRDKVLLRYQDIVKLTKLKVIHLIDAGRCLSSCTWACGAQPLSSHPKYGFVRVPWTGRQLRRERASC